MCKPARFSYTYTFVPVVDFTIVRLVQSFASQNGWLTGQMDYIYAFLQVYLDRKVYIFVPKIMGGVPIRKVCHILKSIYCLNEAPRIWYGLLSKDLKSIGLHLYHQSLVCFLGTVSW